MRQRPLTLAVLGGVALACALGVWRLYADYVASGRGQAYDQRLTDALAAESDVSSRVLRLIDVVTLALALLVAVAIGLIRRRLDLSLAAVVVIGASNVTTQLLKDELDRPGLGLGTLNSFPSGHTTAAASAAAALVVVLPWALRIPAALAGTAAAVWVGTATVAVGWHRVSDVVGAVLVVLGWTALALLLTRRRVPAVDGPAAEPPYRDPARVSSG